MKITDARKNDQLTFEDLEPGAVFLLPNHTNNHGIPMMKIEAVNRESPSITNCANAIDLTTGSYYWLWGNESVTEMPATLTLGE